MDATRTIDRPLFGSSGPVPDDVDQNGLGSCWLLAGLRAVSSDSQNAIHQAIAPLPDRTFLVRWNDRVYRHDARLPSADGTNPAYAGLGHDGSLWVALIEKAVADTRTGLTEVFTYGNYDSAETGTPGEVFGKLGGDRRNVFESMLDDLVTPTARSLANWIADELADGHVVCATSFLTIGSDHLYSWHAYHVLDVIHDSAGEPTHVDVFNPWNADVLRDGSGAIVPSGKLVSGDDDGLIRVTIAEFFNHFDRAFGQMSVGDFDSFE